MDILLVEDNANDAELAMLALQRARFSGDVVRAEDGVEALELLGIRCDGTSIACDDIPRVVFLDLKLPKLDGLQVLKQLKSNERTRQIPVVMLTSSREETDVATAYQLGVNSYIVKPVNFDEYQSAIASLAQYWTRLNQPSPTVA